MTGFLDTYKNLRVLVTGHTGFKGTWLVSILNEIGAEVAGYALAPETDPNHFDLLDLSDACTSVIGDLADLDRLSRCVADFQPDLIFHMAAQPIVRTSYLDPVRTFQTNVLGSVHLMEVIRHLPSVRGLVFVTSDKCYENVEWVWGYRETDRLGGQDPYSASKAASEIAFSAYDRSFFSHRDGFAAATARAGNVIGGGDWSTDRIVPDCFQSIQRNEPIVLRNPNATRPWQHVLEPLSGYLLLGQRLLCDPDFDGGSWNFGPTTSEVRTVEEVARSMIGHLGQGTVKVETNPDQPHEAQLLQLNCDKANQQLGWRPRWNVDKTFEATGHWYAEFLRGADMKQITRSQIREYFGGEL